jgi:hypothetical protein
MSAPNIKASGNIAIVWGTKNGSNLGLIVETLTVTPKNGKPVDIEDGDGFTVVQAMLDDGFDATASCVYDSNKALPNVGAAVTVVVPKVDGNVGQRNLNVTYWSHSVSAAKKKERMVDLAFTYRPELNT